MARRILRLAVAPVVLPHELAHAAAALAVGLTPEVRLLPPHDGTTTPLGQFDADLPASTPAWRVRLVAVAPLVVYVIGAVLLRLTVAPAAPGAVLAVVPLAYWGSLSAGDVAVAAAPDEALEAGRFAAGVTRRTRAAADALTLLVALVVAAVLLA